MHIFQDTRDISNVNIFCINEKYTWIHYACIEMQTFCNIYYRTLYLWTILLIPIAELLKSVCSD